MLSPFLGGAHGSCGAIATSKKPTLVDGKEGMHTLVAATVQMGSYMGFASIRETLKTTNGGVNEGQQYSTVRAQHYTRTNSDRQKYRDTSAHNGTGSQWGARWTLRMCWPWYHLVVNDLPQ